MGPELPAAALGFFAGLPEAFAKANESQWELYEETLYTIRDPFTYGNFHSIQRFTGSYNAPRQALADRRAHLELNALLSSARYPDASSVGLLESFAAGSMELATALLHFFNPAYPLYDASTVGGLQRIGFTDVRYVSTIEEDAGREYGTFIDAIQALKDAAPYQAVPEKNYYLTRIIQAGLWALGVASPAPEAANRPKPTLR